MTADNLSRVFALTVIKREDPMEMAQHVTSDAAFVSHLIQRLPVLAAEPLDPESEDGHTPQARRRSVEQRARPPRSRRKGRKAGGARLMLDDPELKDRGMNKGGKRQTLWPNAFV